MKSLAKWNPDATFSSKEPSAEITTPRKRPDKPAAVYAASPEKMNFVTLQNNLQDCLVKVNNEVMRSYLPNLQNCAVAPLEQDVLEQLDQIQFFRITELVYQEDEFSVPKLATVFSTLSNKPCTLVLMIRSDGQTNEFYLGVRSRDPRFSGGTMRQLLEQSLLGLFPGSRTADYFSEQMQTDLKALKIGAVSSVTCIADYKQNRNDTENRNYVQGLEKFVDSMQGKSFTAICIANNLGHQDLAATRSEYENLYTLMSPFATIQYNYGFSQNSSTSSSDTRSEGQTDSANISSSIGTNQSNALSQTQGSSLSRTVTATQGQSQTISEGKSHTEGKTDGFSNATTRSKSIGIAAGIHGGVGLGDSASIGGHLSVSGSVSRSHTHGTSHSDSLSDSVSRSLTSGLQSSLSEGSTFGTTASVSQTQSMGSNTQHSESKGRSTSVSYAQTKALTDTFGNSQGVSLPVKNKSIIHTLERLEKQLKRLDECESIGMWDFAAYFLGESAAEAETAASVYRSLVSGNQSGLELSAVNTWTEDHLVRQVSDYVTHFLHPVFVYATPSAVSEAPVLVDATVLSSTAELAIQLGLPRKSIKGLPVIEHASFGQEILVDGPAEKTDQKILLGRVNHFGKSTGTEVALDVQSLAMHTFITGSTGSGKSNTIYGMLCELQKHGVHFLVIEPAKGEYKGVFGKMPEVHILGTNPRLGPVLKINPFRFVPGIHVLEHIDRLVEIFNVCWPMYAAMPAVLKEAILQAYVACGWDLNSSTNLYSEELFPTFADLQKELVSVIHQSGYSEEVKSNYIGSLATRVNSLTNGLSGQIFSADEIDSQILFDGNVIVDLSRVGSAETKALIMGLLVMRLNEYRMVCAQGSNLPLRHVTVLEEAHNLLQKSDVEQSGDQAHVGAKSVEMLANSIAEMRTYGEGFIIADQSPGAIDISAIRNTNTKIIMRLPEEQDRRLAGKAAALRDEQLDEVARLPRGVAVVYQNNWVEPILCSVRKFELPKFDPHAEKKCSVMDTPEPLPLLVKALLAKNSGDSVPETVRALPARIPRMNLTSKAKIQALRVLRSNGKCTLASSGSVLYDVIYTPVVEQEACQAESLEEWRDVLVYGGNGILSELTEREQNLALEAVIQEMINRQKVPGTYLQTWRDFCKRMEEGG